MKILKALLGITFLSMFPGVAGIVSAQPAQESEIVVPFVLEDCIQGFLPPSEVQSSMMERRADETSKDLPLAAGNTAPTATTAVALVASDKDGRGVLSISTPQKVIGNATRKWSAEISAPFSKSENQAVFASFAGLSGDIVATGSYSKFHWDISPESYGRVICQACEKAGVRDLLQCNQSFLAQGEELETKLYDALFGPMVAKVWSLESSVGRKERTYFASNADKANEHRTGHSFSAVGGMIFQRSSIILPRWSTFTKLTGKRDYKENDKATLCKPITDSILENCISQPLGEAKKIESLILATEGRFFFSGSALGEFALAPSAQYDFEAKVWGFEVPFFLVRNSDKNFTGGVKLAWRSDQDDLVAAVFISRALRADAP